MIKGGVYRLMLAYRDVEYEPVEIVGDAARQRVTLTGVEQSITYVFFLSRQTGPACEGCWMADAVGVERVLNVAA